MLIHAGVQATLAVGFQRIGGHGDDGQGGKAGIGAQLARGLQPVHDRHLHVHQHQVVRLALHLLHGHVAVTGQIHLHARCLQQLLGHLLVERVVLYQQHTRTMQCRRSHHLRTGGRTGQGQGGIAGQRLHQGIEQDGGAHRFDQYIGNALHLGRAHHVLTAKGSHQNQARQFGQAQAAHATRQLQPVHFGHLPVQQDQGKRLPGGTGTAQHGQRQCARMRLLHHKAHGLQHLSQYRSRVGVVVHHQHTASAQIRRWQQHARRCTPCQRHRQPEGRALPHLAGYAHAAPHEFGQALADGQAQPRATVFAGGGGIGLLKALEQLRHLCGRQADAGIAHLKAQHHLRCVLFLHPHGDADLATLGELDGVVGIVDQNLPQAQRITHQIGGHVRGHIANQLQPLNRCLVAHHIHHPRQHLV